MTENIRTRRERGTLFHPYNLGLLEHLCAWLVAVSGLLRISRRNLFAPPPRAQGDQRVEQLMKMNELLMQQLQGVVTGEDGGPSDDPSTKRRSTRRGSEVAVPSPRARPPPQAVMERLMAEVRQEKDQGGSGTKLRPREVVSGVRHEKWARTRVQDTPECKSRLNALRNHGPFPPGGGFSAWRRASSTRFETPPPPSHEPVFSL